MSLRLCIFLFYLFTTYHLVAAVSFPSGIKVAGDCDAQMQSVIKKAIVEAEDMLKAVEDRLHELKRYLLDTRDGGPLNVEKAKVAQDTFRNIIYPEMPRTEDLSPSMSDPGRIPPARYDSAQRVNRVKRLVRALVTFFNKEPTFDDEQIESVEITCTLDWLVEVEKGSDLCLDIRRQFKDYANYWTPKQTPLDWEEVKVKSPMRELPGKENERAAVVFRNLGAPYTEVIYLDKAHEPNWLPNFPEDIYPTRQFEQGTGAEKQNEYLVMRRWPADQLANSKWWLYQLIPRHLTLTLIQALSQTQAATEESDVVLQEPGVPTQEPNVKPLTLQECSKGGSHRASTWSCVIDNTKDSAKANSSSLNFEYLVLALYLWQWDWSTGYSRMTQDPRNQRPEFPDNEHPDLPGQDTDHAFQSVPSSSDSTMAKEPYYHDEWPPLSPSGLPGDFTLHPHSFFSGEGPGNVPPGPPSDLGRGQSHPHGAYTGSSVLQGSRDPARYETPGYGLHSGGFDPPETMAEDPNLPSNVHPDFRQLHDTDFPIFDQWPPEDPYPEESSEPS